MDLFDLGGKAAIVTGGNGGIGLGIARGLAGAGAKVAIVARNRAKAKTALAELGKDALFVEADVTDAAACREAVRATVAKFGRLDILVNNAGTNIRKQPEEYSLAEWRSIIELNLTAAFVLTQAAYPEMKRAGGGKIVNIGSMTTIFGAPYSAPYGATKGGIVQLTRSLATAWAKDNIQVNAVLPGYVDSELTRQARQQIAGLEERVTARTPAKRWGIPADFAGIAVFLCSAASDFVTGTAIPVDGGYSILG